MTELAETSTLDENACKNACGDVARDSWSLVKCINRGQYGSVHIGQRSLPNASVVTYCALKRAHSSDADIPPSPLVFTLEEAEANERSNQNFFGECVTALKREAVALGRFLTLQTPAAGENVVRCFGLVEIDSTPHLAMELMECNLAEYLHELRWGGSGGMRAIPPVVVRAVATQTLAALRQCREAGVIHCDVKPGNFLVNRVEVTPQNPAGIAVKLADFGLCKMVNPAMKCPRMRWRDDIVTLQYRAPELLFGLSYGYGIDVWAWGCIVAEMISPYGQLPFGSPTCEFAEDTEDIVVSRVMGKLGVPTEATWPSLMTAIKERETREKWRYDALFANVRPVAIDTFYCGPRECEPDILALDAALKNRILVWPLQRWNVYKLETHLDNLFRYTSLSPTLSTDSFVSASSTFSSPVASVSVE